MKQITECLDRAFNNKKPLKKKWRAGILTIENVSLLIMFHYHHMFMAYDLNNHVYLHEWYETSADLRGLNAAKKYLEEHSYEEICDRYVKQ